MSGETTPKLSCLIKKGGQKTLFCQTISAISLQEKAHKPTKHTFPVLENEIDLGRLQIK